LSASTLGKAESNDKFSKAVESFVDAVNTFTGNTGPKVTTSGKTTGQNRYKDVVNPMGKPGGTLETIGKITYIYDNMGNKYDITTPTGIKLKAVFKKAIGGYISGAGNATSDSIPAMLSNGEYVINAKSVQAAGIPMLDRINKMAMGGPVYNVPAYSVGGRVKYDNGGMATSSNSLYNINVTLNGTDMSPDDVANAIERKMRLREATMGRGRSN
jgi:hypothetical protein